MPDYFIPDIYADCGYMICSEVVGIRTICAGGMINLHVGATMLLDGQDHEIIAFLGEVSEADSGEAVWPLIVAFAKPHSGKLVHYALEELIDHEISGPV